MLNETQLVIAVAGVCVLALALIVLGWRRLRGEDRADGHVVIDAVVVDEPGRLVLARTHDGTQYHGTLAETDDAHANGAYLTLTGPIVFRRGGGETETMPSEWDRLALPLADVAEVWTRSPAAVAVPNTVAPVLAPETSPEDDITRLRGGVDDAAADDVTTTSRRHTRRDRRSRVTTP